MTSSPSVRSQVVTLRSYARPLDESDTRFESWDQIINRVIGHQRWLWERALNRSLDEYEETELRDLRRILVTRRGMLAGRTMWLGGTPTGQSREASQFNCAGLHIETVYDMVDAFWLLLQGCGVGAQMVPGTLHGFPTRIPRIEVRQSTRTEKGGRETNLETYKDGVWTISVGDSAQAWAKSVGKLLAGKRVGCKTLVISTEEIRPAGSRLKGYGWICHGDKPLSEALFQIAQILNTRYAALLTRDDLHSIFNILGTVLSSRRSAQIVCADYPDEGWLQFVNFKRNAHAEPWKYQSNNTLNFHTKPSAPEILGFLNLMRDAGGSEPGMRNVTASRKRAPWCRITNPCAEILLPNKGFCNLVTINLAHPDHADWDTLVTTGILLARANYRQTCVNLEDGILQRVWHENNESLRLCGVSLTGWCQFDRPFDIGTLQFEVALAARGMAEELQLPPPAAVTTVKPEGTASKVLDSTEGAHQPIGRYVFNNINFSPYSPIPGMLEKAGYKVWKNPTPGSDGVLVTFPIDYGPNVNPDEPALDQLERYRFLTKQWAEHNVSITVYYHDRELPEIANWLHDYWDDYISVSFLPREEKGTYAYRPQEVVDEKTYNEYVAQLKPVDLTQTGEHTPVEDPCATGACPVI